MKDITKPQTLNDVSNGKTIYSGNFEKATVRVFARGELANGKVVIHYENIEVVVPYETIIGPDGLMTIINEKVGNMVPAYIEDGKRINVQITQDVLELSRRARSSVNVVQSCKNSQAVNTVGKGSDCFEVRE